MADLQLAKEMHVKKLLVSGNSQLVVSQVKGIFTAKDSSMAACLKLVMNFIPSFKKFKLVRISHAWKTFTSTPYPN